jgi:hypothetical protein
VTTTPEDLPDDIAGSRGCLLGRDCGDEPREKVFGHPHGGTRGRRPGGGHAQRRCFTASNPDKLGDAKQYLAGDLPGVIETRARFEIEREQTSALWDQRRTDTAAARQDYQSGGRRTSILARSS